MFDIWTANLQTDEEKENFKNSLRGAKPVLNRLAEILEMKETELDRSMKSLKQYQSPNWVAETAHKNGYASALSNMKELISLDQQKDN